MNGKHASWFLTTVATLALCSACGAAQTSDNGPPVAAVDVPLTTQGDRDAFILILRDQAVKQGFHVDSASSSELKQLSDVSPITVNAAVWRGKNDDEVVASAIDGADHIGRVWLTFEKGSDPKRFSAFRS